MNNTIGNVTQWGYDKGILRKNLKRRDLDDARAAQFRKTLEEVEELGAALLYSDREEVCDSIGDIIVTLIMQAELWDTSIQDCLDGAYQVIRKRTGKMVDGQFVKDEA